MRTSRRHGMKTITLVQAGALVALTIMGAYAASGATTHAERAAECSGLTCERVVGEV